MCLAVPGRVTAWVEHQSPFKTARVEFDGVGREVNMECVPQAIVGDYVLVHAGIAIGSIDEQEAESVLAMLKELDWDDELASLQAPDTPQDDANGGGA